MAPKRKASAKKQQPITQHALPFLKKPMEQIGKQINVPGSFWDGRMSTDERNTSYKSVPAEVDITDIAYILAMSWRRHRQAPIGAQRSSRPRTAQPPSLASAASSSARFGPAFSLTNDGAGASSSEPAAQQTHGGGVRVTVDRHGGHQQIKVHAVCQGNQGALLFQISRQGRRARREPAA